MTTYTKLAADGSDEGIDAHTLIAGLMRKVEHQRRELARLTDKPRISE